MLTLKLGVIFIIMWEIQYHWVVPYVMYGSVQAFIHVWSEHVFILPF